MQFPHPFGRLTRLFGAALGLVAACSAGIAIAADPGAFVTRTAARATTLAPFDGEVIVQFKPGAGAMQRHALSARAVGTTARQALDGRAEILGQRIGRRLTSGAAVGEGAQVVRAEGIDAPTLAARLAEDPDVAFAEPNYRRRITAAPNDPLYAATAPGLRPRGPDSGQWYLRAPTADVASGIDIERAWAITLGQAGIVVAVLDTGVRPEHPDLQGRLLPGYNFVADSAVSNTGGSGRAAGATDPGDWTTAAENSDRDGKFYKCDPEGTGQSVASRSSWHGTHTASLVGAAANDGIGMAGAAPGVRVLPVRVLGKCFGSDADIQAGMRWAAGIAVAGVPVNPNPARVLNLSLGGTGACTSSYQQVVDEILAKGAVIVAAAGNSAGGPVGTPANCRGVIGVAALRHAGSKVGFSDLGSEITIAAPGGNCVNIAAGSPCLYSILAASNTGTTVPLTSTWTDSFDISVGTSFSAPLVAGVAGLMLSAQPLLTPTLLRDRMRATARAFPAIGASNGSDPTPVPVCHAPSANVEQLQCYCTTAVCGAGMLDAGAAVAAAAGVLAQVSVSPANPTAGSAVVFNGAGSLAAPGASVVSYAWSISDGGGIVSAFSSATNASTATLTPIAAGRFTVRLTVTDSLGNSAGTTQTVDAAAAPVPVPAPTPTPTPTAGGSRGGGAMSGAWLLLLLSAVVALARRRRHAAG
ncbi:MAG: S8 family serine peptidase [Rubrivivax sp.]